MQRARWPWSKVERWERHLATLAAHLSRNFRKVMSSATSSSSELSSAPSQGNSGASSSPLLKQEPLQSQPPPPEPHAAKTDLYDILSNPIPRFDATPAREAFDRLAFAQDKFEQGQLLSLARRPAHSVSVVEIQGNVMLY